MQKITWLMVLAGSIVMSVSSHSSARTIPGGAVEQIEDLSVHTAVGTSDGANFQSLGKSYDGGDGVLLMKWDVTGFPSPLAGVVSDFERLNDGDGSFTIHQMFTNWNESTDYGTTLPVAGVDYQSAPIASIGFNDGKNIDKADLSKLFQYWQANPSNNQGVVLVPRGQINSAYPNSAGTAATGTFNNQITFASRTRVAGIDSNDLWVVPTAGASTQQTNVLKPMADTSIIENLPHNVLYHNLATTGMFGKTGERQVPLMKFGFGELMLENTVTAVDSAQFEVHITSPTAPEITFGVHKMLSDWDEATVTWAQFGGSGPQAGVDYESVAAAIGTLGGGAGIDTLDLTDLVNDWLANPGTDFGFILVPITQVDVSDNIALITSERVLGALDGDDTRLIVTTSIPEPATFAFLGLSAASLLLRRSTRVA